MQRIPYIFLAIFCALAGLALFLGNSSGAAASGNFRTGAPSAGGGTEGTCRSCHNGGNFGDPQLSVSFAEAGSDAFGPLSSYVPGTTYQVSVAVGHGSTKPAGYGFQAQIITDAGMPPSAAGTLTRNSDNTQVITGGGARQYAEQMGTSNDSVFIFNWTAPEAGTGGVSLYTVGNLVNRAAGSGGDNGSRTPTIVSLSEGAPSSVGTFASLPAVLYPNPATRGGRALLDFTAPISGLYTLTISNAGGQQVRVLKKSLSTGAQQLGVDLSDFNPGLYLVTAKGQGHRWTGKLVVH